MDSEKILDTSPSVKGLCKLANLLNYNDPCRQLINNDGTCVGDLLLFLEDNPGACAAIIDWAAINFGSQEMTDENEET